MITLPQLFQEWLEVKVYPSKRSTETIKKYDYMLKLLSQNLNLTLDKIKPSSYQIFFNKICKNSGFDYAQRINRAIQKAILYGQWDGYEIHDFTIGLELFPANEKKKREDKYLQSKSDFNKVLKALESRFDYHKTVTPYYLYILLETGLRPAELLALRFSDINIKNSTLSVGHRISTVTLKEAPPKNRFSVRTIPISKNVLKLLLELKERQSVMLDEYNLKNPRDLIFYHRAYRHELPSHAALSITLKDVLSNLGIEPQLSLYGARHTKLSLLMAEDFPMPVVAKYAGHSNVNMIINTYGGLLREEENEYFEKLKK